MLITIWRNYSYVILLMGLAVAMSSIALIKLGAGEAQQEITVKEGDSLWKIAQELSEDYDMSTQAIVEWVTQKNNLATDIIKPGESLIIPGGNRVLLNNADYELASGTE
ncbi:LysM peptidoglycan-binding domain-containing protein [Rossellomorea vietnamensis]|uniref:LysM peptidoglycan-binding domain-containing protein n=1 Tax=Rossellomorea vietnamensis TaxID=218284 RepID=A0A5D4NP99_9BACI|nr:LysM peptidoglycan-binding domain-containing protein [Rossellomorea vietnamensis]TYS16165.1 LysM peptidoglycan-binding domain-containing protein [Rossellomorea vietnamensis]